MLDDLDREERIEARVGERERLIEILREPLGAFGQITRARHQVGADHRIEALCPAEQPHQRSGACAIIERTAAEPLSLDPGQGRGVERLFARAAGSLCGGRAPAGQARIGSGHDPLHSHQGWRRPPS